MKTNINFFDTVPEAITYVKNKYGYLTMVSNELPQIEKVLKDKGVTKVEGETIFVDELGLLK